MNRLHYLPLPAALVLSGFGALGVEVLWQRLLSRMLGGSTNALTAVLIAYMGGLALGAAIAGRRGDRLTPRAALGGYVRLEITIWATVSAVTLLLAVLPAGLGGWLASIPEGGPRFLARFTIALLVLLIPTTAMGATLPLAVRAAVGGQGDRLLRGTGLLYAANTFGAALGALAGPLVLMPWLGVRNAALACALASLLAALVARSFDPGPARADIDTGGAATEHAAPPGSTPTRPAPVFWVAVVSFAVGAAALGLQVLWTRWLTMWAGSSVQGFGMVLAVVLLGIVLGSAAVSALSRRLDTEAPTVCGVLAVVGAALALVLLPVVDAAPGQLARLSTTGQLTVGSGQRLLVALAAALALLPTLCFGAVLPMAVRAARAGAGASAAAVGRIYATNTVGALCGAAATGLLLVPTLGLARSALLLCTLPVVAGTALLVAASRGRGRRLALGLALGACGAATLVAARPPSPYAAAARGFVPREGIYQLGRVLYHGEGPEASVLVEAARERRTFYVNGRAEASTGWSDTREQYLLGHLPAFVAGGADRSLVIGLGAGMTAGALTRWGAVTIAELNRAVPGATRQFTDYNHGVLDKAHMTIEDGRVVVALPGERYDVITTDPIHPGVAGCASLFTTEHLRLCRSRLAPGGAVSLWLPLYQMGPEELRAIVGSFVDVFPDAELYLNNGQSTLIGGGRPRTSSEVLALIRSGWNAGVAADLFTARLESPEAVHVTRVAGPEELRRFVGEARRNRDDDPWIELSLTRYLYRGPLVEMLDSLLALRPAAERQQPRVRAFEALQRTYGTGMRNEDAVHLLADTLVEGRSPLLEHAMRLRELSAGMALDLARAGRRDDAFALARNEIEHADATIESLLTAREAMDALGMEASIDAVDQRLIGQWPQRPEGHYYAGQKYIRRARFAEAIPHLERAAATPGYPGYEPLALGALGMARLMDGDIDEGRSSLRRALDLNPRQTDLRKLLAASPETLAAVRRSFESEAAAPAM
jgi:spermidine synthase